MAPALSPSYVKFNVRCEDGSVDAFKMKRQYPLSTLEDAYCFKTKSRAGSVELRRNGKPVPTSKSPEDLSLHDDDWFDVVSTR